MEREKIHSCKRPAIGWLPLLYPYLSCPLSTPNAKPKPSTTAGSSSKENAPQQPTAPLTTANGHPSICPIPGIPMLIPKGLLPRHRLVSPTTDLASGLERETDYPETGCCQQSSHHLYQWQNVGEHAGGYTACSFNITPFLSFDTPNTLAICVDNARQDIAPISGDFTFFGGIYRDVWLTAVPNQHFNLTNHSSDGLFISTPQVSEERGIISIRGEVKNDAKEKQHWN